MLLEYFKNFYSGSPVILKRLYSMIPWDIRMGRVYRDTYHFLQKSIKWDARAWQEYQNKEIRCLLMHCYTNVPYYRDLFDKHSVDPFGSDIFTEFNKIPFLDKKTVIENQEMLKVDNLKLKNVYMNTTGGTTGPPATIFHDNASYYKEWAFKIFFWGIATGYSVRDKKATFRGVSDLGSGYIENPIYNEIRYSPFHLSREKSFPLIKHLINYQPKYLHGYPSAILDLIDCLSKYQKKLVDVKAVFLISENFDAGIRSRIEEFFNCDVYSFYGHSERLIFASMGSCLKDYFVHPAYGYTELLDENDNVINDVNKRGMLVGTGFLNKSVPLLRYKTDDFTSYTSMEGGDFFMPTIGPIEGRWDQSYIVCNSRKISLTALNMHSKVQAKIRKMQYLHPNIGTLILNIVVNDNFNENDYATLMSEYQEKLGTDINFKICIVRQLIKTKSGKEMFFVRG